MGRARRRSALRRRSAARGRIAAILDTLQSRGDFRAAAAELRTLFQQVIAYADAGDSEAFVESAFAIRLVGQLGGERLPHHRRPLAAPGAPGGAERIALLKFLLANGRLARAMSFTVKADVEDPGAVYALLGKLRAACGSRLNDYAYLAAALCVVHDRPLRRHINENAVRAPDPLAIFRYFATNEKRMRFGVRTVPPELLIFVVDTTASLQEMAWALGRFQGDGEVGRRYFNVKYDTKYYRKGITKKLAQADAYSLPNILKHGGICADQAYFAVSVGKAIGVPTCYARGRGADTGHAWVGFFQVRGRQGFWNFRYGRYRNYLVVRGIVEDPQTRRWIPSDYVSVLAELMGTGAANRYAAVAYVDAARFLRDLQAGGKRFAPPRPAWAPAGAEAARRGGVQTQLALIEQGLRRGPGYAPGWLLVARLAGEGKLSLDQKKYWAGVLQRMCGKRYPDFLMAVVKPMIETVGDVSEQNALWSACFGYFRAREDLAAEIRMAQAAMWEKAAQPNKAGKCYEDVLMRYVNSGPFVIDALNKTAQKLRELGREREVPELYRLAWSKCRRPVRIAPRFMRGSNWYRLGRLYVDALYDAGLSARAKQVKTHLVKAVTP